MDVLGAAVARARRDRLTDAPALVHGPSGRVVDYRRFCTTAWKVGNLLRNEGVRSGTPVVVADDPSPRAATAFYGAALLGATVSFGLDGAIEGAGALVGPTSSVLDRDPAPGTGVVAYGGDPCDPTVAYFERDVWSENPTEPPDRVRPGDVLLRGAGRAATHRDLLTAAGRVVDDCDLGVGDVVAVRASLGHPGTVAAGLVAPVVAGATVLFPEPGDAGNEGDASESDATSGDVAVGAGSRADYPEEVVVAPAHASP